MFFHKSLYSNKYQRLIPIINQYPTIDLHRQYKHLVIKRAIYANFSAFLLQYISIMASTIIISPSPIWFATGTACGLIFLRGYKVLIGLWLGYFFTYFLSFNQYQIPCKFATVFVLQSILLRWFTIRYINPTLVFYESNRLLKFIIFTCLLSIIVCIFLIWLTNKSYLLLPTWSLANFNGVLIGAIAWVSADSLYAFNGKSIDSRELWCKITRFSFTISIIVLVLSYIIPMPIQGILLIQLCLCLFTLSGLFLALRS